MALRPLTFALGTICSILFMMPTSMSSEHLTSNALLQCDMTLSPVSEMVYADVPGGDLRIWHATLRCGPYSPAKYISTTPVGPWVRM